MVEDNSICDDVNLINMASVVTKDLLLLLPPRKWHSVPLTLQSAHFADSLCAMIGVEFERLAAVFLFSKILKTRKTKNNENILTFNANALEKFKAKYLNLNIEHSDIRAQQGEKKVRIHYLLRGKPTKNNLSPIFINNKINTIPTGNSKLPTALDEKINKLFLAAKTNEKWDFIFNVDKENNNRNINIISPVSGNNESQVSSGRNTTQSNDLSCFTFSNLNIHASNRPNIQPTQFINNENNMLSFASNQISPLSFTNNSNMSAEEKFVVLPNIKKQIDDALALNFNTRTDEGMRPPRNSNGQPIKITFRKRPTVEMRLKIVVVALSLGWSVLLNGSQKKKISNAAVNIVAYDNGFLKPSGKKAVSNWFTTLGKALKGVSTDFGLTFLGDQTNFGKKKYCMKIEDEFPGYLHTIFRKAQNEIGIEANFKNLAAQMNKISTREEYDDKPTLSLSHYTLHQWFTNNEGITKKRISKPVLTPERMELRVEWCKEIKKYLIACENGEMPFFVCFLDEKWFYTRSNRKKAKYLPKGNNEEDDPKYPTLRFVSRRHAAKVMYLGVTGCPIPGYFNGKVLLERVSEKAKYSKSTWSDQFADEVQINELIKREWQKIINADMTGDEMKQAVVNDFDLDEDMAKRLTFRYVSKASNGKNNWHNLRSDEKIGGKTIFVINDEGERVQRPLKIEDLVMKVSYKKGETYEKDQTCDSKFMAKIMPEIGEAMRKAYHFVPKEIPLFLIMDNAGGHGKKDCIEEYTNLLKEKYNIIIIHQEPRSPETNCLDLGIWNSFQSLVENMQIKKRTDVKALVGTVEQAWYSYFTDDIFQKVYKRWQQVLEIIICDEGNNKNVDKHRNEKYENAILPPPPPYKIPEKQKDDEDDSDADSSLEAISFVNPNIELNNNDDDDDSLEEIILNHENKEKENGKNNKKDDNDDDNVSLESISFPQLT